MKRDYTNLVISHSQFKFHQLKILGKYKETENWRWKCIDCSSSAGMFSEEDLIGLERLGCSFVLNEKKEDEYDAKEWWEYLAY